MCVYPGVCYFSDTDITESFSQKIPSHKYQFDVKQHKERRITSSDFSIVKYRKDKHAKSNFKKMYKIPSSDWCFDPLSRKRHDFKNDSVMLYKVFCLWVVAAVVMCTILGQWRTLSLYLQDYLRICTNSKLFEDRFIPIRNSESPEYTL